MHDNWAEELKREVESSPFGDPLEHIHHFSVDKGECLVIEAAYSLS